MSEVMIMKSLVAAIVFAVTGMLVLVLGFFIFDRLTPGNLWKEIIEEHNTAVALFMGAFMIAVSIIIASAIKG